MLLLAINAEKPIEGRVVLPPRTKLGFKLGKRD